MTISWGSEGGQKLSTKSLDPLVVEGMVDVGIVKNMVGISAT